MRQILTLLPALALAACGSRVPGDGPTDGGDGGADAPTACTTSAVLVTDREAAYGTEPWEWARNNPYLAADAHGGIFVTYRFQERYPDPFPQHLEHYDRQGRRLLGSSDAPFVVCPGALKPGLGIMVADGAGGVFMSVWVEEARTGIRRSQVQHLGADGAPLWASSDFGINLTATDNPGGDVALVLMPARDSGVAAYFHVKGTTGTFLQVFDVAGNRRWPDGRLAYTPAEGEIDSPYIVRDDDQQGGFWLSDQTLAADGTTAIPSTVLAQHYTVDGEQAFPDGGVAIASGVFAFNANSRSWPDDQGGYLVLYGDHGEPYSAYAESWTEALFVARVAPDGELLWGSGVPLTTTMGYTHRLSTPNPPGAAEGVPDGRGGVIVGWPEDRDGDGVNECYGQYVAPDGTPGAPADGVILGGGSQLLCSAMFTAFPPYIAQTADGDMVFTAMQPVPTLGYSDPWRLSFQKLHRDLTARWGPEGALAMACDPALATHGLCSNAELEQVEGVVPDAEGGVYAAWSTCEQLWIVHITADGQTDWTP